MPIRDFTKMKLKTIKKEIEEIVSMTENNSVIYNYTFIVDSDKRRDKVIELLKKNNYKVYVKRDNSYEIRCPVGDNDELG